MKKNPLEEIYESKILFTEAKDNVVKGSKELDSKIGKAPLVAGGPEKAKKDLDTPEEAEGTKTHSGEPKVLKDSMETEPKKAFEGTFEKLFKATINEEMTDEEPQTDMDMELEIPSSNDEMADELESTEDEVSDLVSDLKSVMDHLQTILDKISDETAQPEESSEDEIEFGNEESELETEEDLEEEPVMREATELKPLGDKSKVLQNKNNKVGSVKPHGGKAHTGDLESDPKLKLAKSHDKSLQNPKGKPEVKSTVKKGEFFK